MAVLKVRGYLLESLMKILIICNKMSAEYKVDFLTSGVLFLSRGAYVIGFS